MLMLQFAVTHCHVAFIKSILSCPALHTLKLLAHNQDEKEIL